MDFAINGFRELRNRIRVHGIWFWPLLAVLVYLLLLKLDLVTLAQDFSYISAVINISAVLAGFLFTCIGIIMTLPQNKFTSALVASGYLRLIHRIMFSGVILLLATVLMGLLAFPATCVMFFFTMGFAEVVLSAFYLYKVVSLSAKSK